MSHTAYPTADDLQSTLFSTGLIDAPATIQQAKIDFAGKIAAAINDFESTTGYRPFLGTTQTRVFDPPGPTIRGTRYGYRARGGERFLEFIDTGLISLTSMTTGVDSVSAGTVRTLGTDFYLYPANAAFEGRPYTRAEFVLPIWGSQQSVHVEGKWGYSLTCPDDVFQAIQDYALYLLSPQLALMVSGGLYSERRLNSETRYAGAKQSPLSQESAMWKKNYYDCVNDYLRL